MIVKIFAAATAVAGAAALTLATMIALVRGTILAVSIGDPSLRILAVCADLVLGTILLVSCLKHPRLQGREIFLPFGGVDSH